MSTRGIFIPLYTDFQILHGVTRYRAILLIHLYYITCIILVKITKTVLLFLRLLNIALEVDDDRSTKYVPDIIMVLYAEKKHTVARVGST